MAGRGPAPKDPSKRACRNADPIGTTVLRFEPADPPDLPPELQANFYVLMWWDDWVGSPQADHFSRTDWRFLFETAWLVNEFYNGNISVAGELRLRQAKFGATPEDRARLRMAFADADDADGGKGSTGAAKSYGHLRMIDPQAQAGEGDPDPDAG
jgi:hypothetical protein